MLLGPPRGKLQSEMNSSDPLRDGAELQWLCQVSLLTFFLRERFPTSDDVR